MQITKVTNKKDIAESLNEYFTGIGPRLSNNLDKTNAQFLDYIRRAECEFNFSYITCETVSNTLKGIKSKKAARPDNISVKLLKDSDDATVPFLATILTYR